MSSPVTNYPPLVTNSDDEVLVRVEGVSKKFCRSLKKSLWYGVCDIGAELNPFRRRVAEIAGSELLVASGNTSAGGGDRAAGASGLVTGNSDPPPLSRTTKHGMRIYGKENSSPLRMCPSNFAGGN